jgi:pimeloyl-ACP methyl ester carboxylesterase
VIEKHHQKTCFVILLFLTTTLIASFTLPPYSGFASNDANSLNVQDIPIQKIQVGDIDIAYKVFGQGDPILLISGAISVMDQWDPTILRDLSSNHTVIIFNNRGVGNTTAGTQPFSIIQFANDTVGLLDALKIQKADVLGFSMGTFIAQELALLHPEKVNRLILVAASCGGQENIPQSPDVVKIYSDFVYGRSQDIGKFLSVIFPLSWIQSHPNNLAPPQSTEIVPTDTSQQHHEILQDWLATNWTGVCNQLSQVTIPTLVVTGTEDVTVPPANDLIIAQKIPGAWLVQFKEAGHGLMLQYPDKVSTVIETFLTTTTATTATPSGNATSSATADTGGTNTTTTATTAAPTLN